MFSNYLVLILAPTTSTQKFVAARSLTSCPTIERVLGVTALRGASIDGYGAIEDDVEGGALAQLDFAPTGEEDGGQAQTGAGGCADAGALPTAVGGFRSEGADRALGRRG